MQDEDQNSILIDHHYILIDFTNIRALQNQIPSLSFWYVPLHSKFPTEFGLLK